MPWDARNTMSLRTEFVLFASQDGANIRSLCRHYGISPATGYKWLQRWAQEGASGLLDRPRIPHHSPNRSSDDITALLRMYKATLLQQAVDVGVNVADVFFNARGIFLTN